MSKTKKEAAVTIKKEEMSDERLKHVISQLNLLPSACAATAIKELSNPVQRDDGSDAKADYGALVEEIRIQSQCVIDGDLGRVEAMLLAQSHTLRKRLANCIYPGPAGVTMMSSPSIDIPRVYHEFKLIQKRSQPPALG